jgi:hypothetical protein
MPQLQLPLFPQGTTLITPEIAFECRDGKVTYIHGHLPVFQHWEKDLASFRYFTTQLVVNGTAAQADIARAFHVPTVTVKRYVKRFRQSSGKDFFAPPPRRSAVVLKGEVKEKRKRCWMQARVYRKWPKRWKYCPTRCTRRFVAAVCIRQKKECSPYRRDPLRQHQERTQRK